MAVAGTIRESAGPTATCAAAFQRTEYRRTSYLSLAGFLASRACFASSRMSAHGTITGMKPSPPLAPENMLATLASPSDDELRMRMIPSGEPASVKTGEPTPEEPPGLRM